ncbi:hypothetical protein PRIPAC_82619 [Pristionchus pacificus]|uniref:Uncharacterized protein n=1 Tax=Pristionchus pacificus TaxID=54126 RepID=A0A454Y3K5_PRIPA|nr:hypothetical protein PRIPAC_82619 [Pristionchus pacificus]|eukprot:PDM79351.1 hypothetical protein PRIPAC_31930 [Pristionchus pacificus]
MLRLTLAVCTMIIFVSESIKFSAQMEKDCGEQLTATLDKESNDEIKSIMQKMIANVQKGDAKASQVIINGLSDAQKKYVNDNYWIRACLPLRSCLECPVEL